MLKNTVVGKTILPTWTAIQFPGDEGEEMEGGVEGDELKFDGLHDPRGGPTMVSLHWASCTY